MLTFILQFLEAVCEAYPDWLENHEATLIAVTNALVVEHMSRVRPHVVGACVLSVRASY